MVRPIGRFCFERKIGPGEVAQVLHHDDGIYPLLRPHPEVVLNTMWALDDFTEANGATRIVAGSHVSIKSDEANQVTP